MRSFIGIAGFAVLVATSAVGCGGPAALSPDEIVPAFIAASQDDARTFHMEWHGTIQTSQAAELGASDISVLATFEFSGADYEGVLTTTFGGRGGSSTTGYAQVGGASFTRYEGGAWQRLDGGANTLSGFDPLTGLTAAGVLYEGPETLEGRPVHRLRVTDPLGALQRSLLPASGIGEIGLIEGGASDYVVFVDGQGIPVAAQLHVDVSMQMMIDPGGDGTEIEYGMTSDYEFTDWGAEITIFPPQVGGQDFPPPPIDFPEKPAVDPDG